MATVEEVITAAIVAVATTVGVGAATAGVADIGVIRDMVTDGDLALGGRTGGDIRMSIATALGGTLPILTIIQIIALLAIHARTTGTMILRRRIPDQATIRMESQDLGDHLCGEGLATRTTQQMIVMPRVRRTLRFCPLTE